MNLGFIGFGNLANAVYQGLKESGGFSFAYYDTFSKDTDIPRHENIEDLTVFADMIWLTVKPQDLDDILTQLKDIDIEGKTIVSPVAGKTITHIEQYLGNGQQIARIMPNLAMAYKKSVTAFATNMPGNNKADDVCNLLEKLGKVVELDESKFDLFTAIFGSGPAFILEFISVFKEKMRELNLTEAVMDDLLLELTQGTTQYFAANRGKHNIEQLIQNITSKGGTTQAGLECFHAHKIGERVERVIDAAKERSEEMSRGGDN